MSLHKTGHDLYLIPDTELLKSSSLLKFRVGLISDAQPCVGKVLYFSSAVFLNYFRPKVE